MFRKLYDEYIEKCIEQLESCNDVQLQKDLMLIREILREAYPIELTQIIHLFTMEDFRGASTSEEELEILKDTIHSIVRHFQDTSELYHFKVKVEGQEENVWRLLQLPARSTLADLAYAIMASMNCEGGHLYSITYKRKTYGCGLSFDPAKLPAKEMLLWEMNLNKKSKMMMTYDFGENYRFIIEVVDIKNTNETYVLEDIKVLEGKGYGIVEDHHYVFDAYYDGDKEAVEEYLEAYSIELDEFEPALPFDLEDCNEMLNMNMATFFEIYEYETYEVDDELFEEDELPFA